MSPRFVGEFVRRFKCPRVRGAASLKTHLKFGWNANGPKEPQRQLHHAPHLDWRRRGACCRACGGPDARPGDARRQSAACCATMAEAIRRRGDEPALWPAIAL